jgi:hypothetical protein
MFGLSVCSHTDGSGENLLYSTTQGLKKGSISSLDLDDVYRRFQVESHHQENVLTSKMKKVDSTTYCYYYHNYTNNGSGWNHGRLWGMIANVAGFTYRMTLLCNGSIMSAPS